MQAAACSSSRSPATPPTRAACASGVGATRSPANQRRRCCQLAKALSQWQTAQHLVSQSRLLTHSARVGSLAFSEYFLCGLEVWQSKRNTSRGDQKQKRLRARRTGLTKTSLVTKTVDCFAEIIAVTREIVEVVWVVTWLHKRWSAVLAFF